MPRRRSDADAVLDSSEASLLDIVDNVLNKGVVLSGDLTIALAQAASDRQQATTVKRTRCIPHDTDGGSRPS